MSNIKSEQTKVSTSVIDWAQIKNTLPKTAWGLVDEVREAYDSTHNEPARAVELALREKTSELRRQFETLKKEAGK